MGARIGALDGRATANVSLVAIAGRPSRSRGLAITGRGPTTSLTRGPGLGAFTTTTIRAIGLAVNVRPAIAANAAAGHGFDDSALPVVISSGITRMGAYKEV